MGWVDESADMQTGGRPRGSVYRMAVRRADGQASGLVCAKTGKGMSDGRADMRAGIQADGLPGSRIIC